MCLREGRDALMKGHRRCVLYDGRTRDVSRKKGGSPESHRNRRLWMPRSLEVFRERLGFSQGG